MAWPVSSNSIGPKSLSSTTTVVPSAAGGEDALVGFVCFVGAVALVSSVGVGVADSDSDVVGSSASGSESSLQAARKIKQQAKVTTRLLMWTVCRSSGGVS